MCWRGFGVMFMRDMLGTIFWAAVLAVLLRLFVLGSYIVPTESMVPTINKQERVIGEKVTLHWRGPEAGDVVTFDDPEEPGTVLIKRVIATGGQVVDLVDGRVVVDGVALSEPYTYGQPSEVDEDFAAVTFPYTVPDDCIWVMGDNRTNSWDSRYFGPVRVDTVEARALFVWWPLGSAHLL